MKTILFFITLFLGISISYAQPTISIQVNSTISCQDDGSLSIQLNGGIPPYRLSVSDIQGSSYFNATITSNNTIINNLPNGEYFIMVYDANWGHGSLRHTIQAQFGASYTITDETCAGNGAITTLPTGGNGPYSYLWSNGATSQSIQNIPSGRYFVAITNGQGCIFNSDSIIVASTPNINVNINTTPKVCNTMGTATAVVTGGSGTYSYYWKTTPIQTSSNAINLNEGQYSLIVTDNSGCSTNEHFFYIFEPDQYTISGTVSNESCLNADGSISTTTSGGTPPYTYLWNTGSTNQNITNLVAYNAYQITATDAMACVSKKSFFLNRTSPLQTTTSSTDALCNGGGGGSASVLVNNGTAPYTYLWNGIASSSSIHNRSAGYYHVEITDAQGCEANTGVYISEIPSCKVTITGKVYNDMNGNCIQDNGEYGIRHTLIEYVPGQYVVTDQNGDYHFDVYPGTYQLSVHLTPSWNVACINAPFSITVNAPTGGTTYNDNDFAIQANSIQTDVYSSLFISPQRPGFRGNAFLHYGNSGTESAFGTVEYVFSNDWDFISSNPMPSSYDPNQRKATWNYTNLLPFENRQISIEMSVDASIALGTPLYGNVSITSNHTDINPINNGNVYRTTVVGSFDPNDIQVSPQGEGTEGYIIEEEELTYRIRFQNTGTASAINISVSNAIDPNLEDYTISILKASHDFNANIKDGIITFDFPNINLPDSNSNEPESHGYIIYKINRKTNLAPGDKMYNQADIYFDFNEAIVTNQVENTIGINTSTETPSDLHKKELTLFPNPCKENFKLKLYSTTESNLSVSLYTISGQQIPLIDEISIQAGEQDVDINIAPLHLPNGMYIVKTVLNNQVDTQQLIINK